MEKREVTHIVFPLVITFLFLVSLVHLGLHISVYGTGFRQFAETGISGFAVGKFSADNVKANFGQFSNISKIVLIAEWAIVVIVILLFIVKRKSHHKAIAMNVQSRQSGSKTDLDVLYELLKDKKSIAISTVAKTFNVQESTVLEWGKVLESNNLATIHYPRFGEPELRSE